MPQHLTSRILEPTHAGRRKGGYAQIALVERKLWTYEQLSGLYGEITDLMNQMRKGGGLGSSEAMPELPPPPPRENLTDKMVLLLSSIRERGLVEKTALYAEFVTRMGYETFYECLGQLIASGLVTVSAEGEKTILGFEGGSVDNKIT
jgi:hypothetical protein